MKYKFILKDIMFFFISIFVYLILITTLNYFNVFNYKVVSVMSFVFMILLFMLCGFKVSRRLNFRGYLSGIIIGAFNIILLLLLALILNSSPRVTSLVFFLILLLSSTIGGMIGINYKVNQE